jgi:ubiquinone/menaquinone biosynthesis C-methylase UbiE
VKEYYDRRAPEYDDWYLGTGRFAERERPGWDDELAALIEALGRLPASRTLDVACGTGFLTRHLPGELVGLDASGAMLSIAEDRAPWATFVEGDATALAFPDRSFGRVFTAHFYGHLEGSERTDFLAEARRIAPELVIVDSALRDDVEPEERQERILDDGSRWTVYKRYFSASGLVSELGGGRVLHAGRWFVAVASP